MTTNTVTEADLREAAQWCGLTVCGDETNYAKGTCKLLVFANGKTRDWRPQSSLDDCAEIESEIVKRGLGVEYGRALASSVSFGASVENFPAVAALTYATIDASTRFRICLAIIKANPREET